MTKMPWVRFFASDWLGGTRGMSAVETGIYITLVATMYERGDPIPEDHSRLARLCGASNSAFKKALDTLVGEGKILRLEAGLWNARVEKEQVYLSEKSEVGSRAANARWGKKDKENNDSEDADALPSQSPGNANQKPYTIYQKSFSLRSKDARAGDFQKFWEVYPNPVGKEAAQKALQRALKRTSIETIIAGAARYAVKTDKRQWCNPVKWLEEGRWDDAPAKPTPNETDQARYQRECREAIQAALSPDHQGPTIDLDADPPDKPVNQTGLSPRDEYLRKERAFSDRSFRT
ncbi:hypothetical protein ASD32_06430 [Rhizobium sp. Root483D2]|nr:hypothetical protein ASD32_06430 [Rhizobium sp. Root483D2]